MRAVLIPGLVLLCHSLAYGKCEFSDKLEFPKEAIVIGIIGVSADREIKLAFQYEKPIILVLYHHGPIKLNIVPKESRIAAIVTYGHSSSELTGQTGSVPILENSDEKGGPCVGKYLPQSDHVPDNRIELLAFRIQGRMRILQLSMKLFPGKKMRLYWSRDFQHLERVD